MNRLIFFILLFTPHAFSQTDSNTVINENTAHLSIEQLLEKSAPITGDTFDLKFVLRTLPDNGWLLHLHEDSSYKYSHWSGWGAKDGALIEKGSYTITNNLLVLKPLNKKSELASKTFYLITSDGPTIENSWNIHCTEWKSRKYCLYEKL